MNSVTAEDVRAFLLARYSEQLTNLGMDPALLPDTFDFLLSGTIDSLGFLELVAALEREFAIELDLSGLDAEQMSVLWPLCQYVAAQANAVGPLAV